MEQRRFLVFGAHPDDCDLLFGASAIQLCKAGHVVKFVSACNGDCGHQSMKSVPLAVRRYAETQASAKVAGLMEYEVMGYGDCTLEPTLEVRARVTRIIREFCPDVVLTHRTCTYHADHRAIGQAVDDAAYLCTVPLYCPETPVPENMRPIFAYLFDGFVTPNPFAADAAMIVDPVEAQKIRLLRCHESQMFEWLPWDRGDRDFDVSRLSEAERDDYIRENYMDRDIRMADEARDVLVEMYGEAGKSAKRAETYMIVERRNMVARQKFQELFKV
ncbi:MAG: PIG-L family deacetylase [Lentisphaeria bacterium]|nr:PIG-L family deacetylase [Lentisphaeria bacterium]